MLLLLLLAALSTPTDPRITYPYELTVTIQKDGRTYSHTETYRTEELCEAEERVLDQVAEQVPDISVSGCEYIGLV